jgi:hypothetical protein
LTKKCDYCRCEKPLMSYNESSKEADGYASTCKECAACLKNLKSYLNTPARCRSCHDMFTINDLERGECEDCRDAMTMPGSFGEAGVSIRGFVI